MTTSRALALLLGLTAFLFAGAIPAHLHADSESGFWDHAHDLTLMAAFGSHACQPDAVTVLGLVLALTAVLTLTAADAASVPLRLSDSRAPPRF